MIIYALTSTGISFEIFTELFLVLFNSYYNFHLIGTIFLILSKYKDIIT